MVLRQFGIKISLPSTRRVLRLRGLSAPRPQTRVYQQNPSVVQQWIAIDFPAFSAAPPRTKAARGPTPIPGGPWGCRRTLVLSFTRARFRTNGPSVIGPTVDPTCMIRDSRATAETSCEFLDQMQAAENSTLYGVVDRMSIHTAKRVDEFLASKGGQLEIHLLPAYSRELNPGELVWSYVKREASQQVIRAKEGMEEELRYITGPERVSGHSEILLWSTDRCLNPGVSSETIAFWHDL